MNGLHNYQHFAKKYLFDILQERYIDNEPMINRITHHLSSENDVRDLVKVVVDAFERGYMKAVADYKDQLVKLGYQVTVGPDLNQKKSW